MESITLPPPQAESRNPAEEDRRRIARFNAGDLGAFDEIVREYQKQVEGLAFRLLGDSSGLDDIVQDIFVTVLTKLKHFRGESRFSTWLTRIAVNRCRTAIRRRRIWSRGMAWLRLATVDSYVTPDVEGPAESAVRVRRAVYDLAEKYRMPIVLRYFENRSIAEIAEILDLAPGTVEVRLTRARHKLKTMLQSELEE
jgi:RNA polymerase sigma-70 factor (ECF subfamily)